MIINGVVFPDDKEPILVMFPPTESDLLIPTPPNVVIDPDVKLVESVVFIVPYTPPILTFSTTPKPPPIVTAPVDRLVEGVVAGIYTLTTSLTVILSVSVVSMKT